MSTIHVCGACKQPIEQENHVELMARVLETNGEKEQDGSTTAYDDYCNACLESGAALRDLVIGLADQRGCEPALAAITHTEDDDKDAAAAATEPPTG